MTTPTTPPDDLEAAAWRVKDFADGWILFHSKAEADREAEGAGNLVEPLFTLSERLADKEALKAALRECSKWATEAGFAKGKLEMSEAAGIVDGWRERTAAAEAALRASQEALGNVEAMLDRYNAPTTDDSDGSLLSLANRIEAKVYADAVAAAKFLEGSQHHFRDEDWPLALQRLNHTEPGPDQGIALVGTDDLAFALERLAHFAQVAMGNALAVSTAEARALSAEAALRASQEALGKAERFLSLRTRQLAQAHEGWCAAAEEALTAIPGASNSSHPASRLSLRVAMHRAPPVEVTLSDPARETLAQVEGGGEDKGAIPGPVTDDLRASRGEGSGS